MGETRTAKMPDQEDMYDYLGRYPDIRTTWGQDLGAALEHYKTHGEAENRNHHSPEEEEMLNYLGRYKDLRDSIGNDPKQAKEHWKENGNFWEPTPIELCQYIANYPDLQEAWVKEDLTKLLEKAREHWRTAGRHEGRNFGCHISGNHP